MKQIYIFAVDRQRTLNLCTLLNVVKYHYVPIMLLCGTYNLVLTHMQLAT